MLLRRTGAALHRLFGGGAGTAAVMGSLALWMAAPLALAARVFARRDF